MSTNTGDTGAKRSRRQRRRGGSTVGWTTGLWLALTAGAVALSVVASALGKEQFGTEDLQWMADAGASLKDSILGFYGILGTVVIAMTADRSLGLSRSRPDSMDQYRRRMFLGLVALVISVSATFSTLLVGWHFLAGDPRDLALLFLIVPANVIIVALAVTVADSARPTLNREIRLLENDQKNLLAALQRVSGVASERPKTVTVVTAVTFTIVAFVPAIGSSAENAVINAAGTIAVAILWFPVCIILARSRMSAETASGHTAMTVTMCLTAFLFVLITATVYLQGLGLYRAVASTALLIGIPTLSGLIAPAKDGALRHFSGRTIAAATARWTELALRPREEELREDLKELRQEKQELLRPRG